MSRVWCHTRYPDRFYAHVLAMYVLRHLPWISYIFLILEIILAIIKLTTAGWLEAPRDDEIPSTAAHVGGFTGR